MNIIVEPYYDNLKGLTWDLKRQMIKKSSGDDCILYQLDIVYYLPQNKIRIRKTLLYDNKANPDKVKKRFNQIVKEITEYVDKLRSSTTLEDFFNTTLNEIKTREEIKENAIEMLRKE